MFPEPPEYVIFRPDNGLAPPFEGLEPGEWPISPRSSSIKGSKKISINSFTRVQTRLLPGWAVTDYKCQGQTFDNVVVDIRRCKSFTATKQYTSVYVQLSRCRKLSGLHLLAPITLTDVSCKPSSELRREFNRLNQLQRNTMRQWEVERI